jgi:hypothetical protein
MDDGGVHPSGMILSTYCFNMEDHILLKTALKNKFDLDSTIQKRKAGLTLYIPKNQLEKLSKLVKQYMIPCMYYKLNGY